jgi:hypothetical protein
VIQRWATGWMIGSSRPGTGTTASKPALEPAQSPIQWVSDALFLGIKWPGRKAGHSPPLNAKVKNDWRYTSTSPIRLMAWYSVGKSTGTTLPFTFTIRVNFFAD